jgi:hypothetical protein
MNLHDFPGLEKEKSNSRTFQIFQHPYASWKYSDIKMSKRISIEIQ